MTGQELGFRKSKEDSAIRLKEPHVGQEEYDARPRQPTCQPGFPPPVHPPTPLLAPLEDVPGTVPGARATRANTTDMGPALITCWGALTPQLHDLFRWDRSMKGKHLEKDARGECNCGSGGQERLQPELEG